MSKDDAYYHIHQNDPSTNGTWPYTILYISRKYSHLVFFSNGGLRLEWSWRSAVPDIDQQSIKQTPAVKGTNKGNYHPRLRFHICISWRIQEISRIPRNNEFKCELNVYAVTVYIGPESDHWLCLSLTHSITDWLLFSKFDWCDPGMGRCQLKTCWACYCCWCWCLETCWQ